MSAAGHEVLVAYPDMDGARRAIEALQMNGISPSRIALVGEGAEHAKRAPSRNTAAGDAGITGRIFWRALWWSVWGGIAGVVAGVLLWAAIGPGDAMGLILWTVTWGLFAHLMGWLWGAYTGLRNGAAWELTFQPADRGRILVKVTCAGREEAERAERILRVRHARISGPQTDIS